MADPAPHDTVEPLERDRLTPLAEGRTAELFRDGDGRVVKLFRAGFPRSAIDHEYLVGRAIASAIDIPAVRGRATLDGRDALVFDHVAGRSGFEHVLRHPGQLGRFAADFAAVHARMHALAAPQALPGLKSVLARNIRMHDLLDPPLRDRILARLDRLPEGTALCHGDFHPGNLLVRGRRTVVLDWMTATRGDPLADVARTLLLLRHGEPGPGTPLPVRLLLGAWRRRFCARYLARYLERTGAGPDGIARWELPVMAARLMEWIPPSEKAALVALIVRRLASSAEHGRPD
jgi:aminoglycoside phosphotransferase (APT) family kinase protein